ncbi:MAG: response regulator [Myxococcales bacterium]|nr:response regulator [Myxococcales bacterium]
MEREEAFPNKVLVVDDDPVFLRLVEGTLWMMGLGAVCVRSAEEALPLLEHGPPRALIVDGLLPGMRGDELARSVRGRYSREELPIVFISAFFRDLRSRAHLTGPCGVDLVLHKPITGDELRSALERLPFFTLAGQREEKGLQFQLDGETELELLSGYLVRARERLEMMRSALGALGGREERAAIQSLRLEAHRFRGSGASFGLPEVSRLGEKLEDLIDALPNEGLTPPLRAEVTGLVEALGEKIGRQGATAIEISSEARALEVWLLDGPGDLALSCQEAGSRGAKVKVFSDVASAAEAAQEERPDLALVAADRAELDGLAAAEQLRALGVSPVVLMTRKVALHDRLEALRRGAAGLIHRLPDADSLLRASARLVSPREGAIAAALDSDPAVLAQLAQALGPQQLSVEPHTRPEELFRALAARRPALAIIRAELEGESGLELVRALKADSRWRSLPVLVLSGDSVGRLQALRAGADDWIHLPFDAEELSLLASRAAARSRPAYDAGLELSSGTSGMAYLKDATDRALSLARRGRALALLVFGVDLSGLREDPQSLEADEVLSSLWARLRQSFRSSDVVARVGEGRIAVLLHDADRETASRLLKANLEALQRSGPAGSKLLVSVRGASASYPEVRGGFEELLKAAERGLEAT